VSKFVNSNYIWLLNISLVNVSNFLFFFFATLILHFVFLEICVLDMSIDIIL